MFDLDKWQEIYYSISKHKLRTALTAFGVFWGIFMLVLLLGAGNGLENGVKGIFSNMAQNAIYVWTGRTAMPYEGMKPGRYVQFDNDDYHALKREIPELRYIDAGNSLRGTYTINYKDKNSSFPVGGNYPDMLKIRSLTFKRGRFINNNDIDQKRKVVVLGERAAEVLFDTENPIGKYIQIKGVHFLVIGVFSIESNDGRNENEKLYIPLPTMQQTYNMQDKISSFSLCPKEDADPLIIEQKVKQLLCRRHKVNPEDKSAIGSFNTGKEVAKFQALFNGISFFIWVVGLGTIIAGIVGVSNIMLIIVKERTKEIGVRKALGAKPSSIVSMIIQESVVITGVAGYLGLVAGIFLLEGVRSIMSKSDKPNPFFSNPEIDVNTAVVATIVLVLAGALAGLIPAQKAARIKPIEALRDE